ncbi:alpha-ribazole phosphatase [Parabacteroides sp. OttesenSCG-928-G07]|nr:alpha-ribazole phosphatase [Parabacteroides sp. OttesenSCG-928-G07]
MEIYLVRHTSVDVPPGHNYGQTDVPLKNTFEEEAEIVKEQLKELSFDRIWTSPLTRCSRLAAYCGFPEAEREDRIKELNFGDWEMVSFESLSEDPRSKPWFEDWINTCAPNGESLMDQYKRVSEFLDEIRKSGLNRVCLFAHGGVLTCARIYAGEYEMKEAFLKMPPYGAVVRLEFD